jgi:two-component system response regulator HydG
MSPSTTLLISKDPSLIEPVNDIVRSVPNLRLQAVADIDQAYGFLQSDHLALLLVHLDRTSDSAAPAALLRMLRTFKRPIAMVVLSDDYPAEKLLTLLRLGAADFLSRPLDLNRLAYLVDVLTVRARLAAPAPQPTAVQSLDENNPFFYVPTDGVGRLMEQVQRVAPQQTTVLLTGETGTGKTRLARLIHDLSPRRDKPFLVLNCGALAANLIESEMFGHVKGAFTGADRERTGKFVEAGSGTLLFDDIDSLPPTLQAKLLRAVEERAFEPVGSNKTLPLQARLIVATNRSLEQEVAAGRFRSDLYYRFNVVAFYVAPLRERSRVIPTMARRFITEFATRNGVHVHRIATAALQALEEYHWPGNVRELRNVIERAVALCPGQEIHLEDLPEAMRAAVPVIEGPLSQTKEEAESARITEALEKHGNNRLRAAAELGISRMTLYNKLRKYNLIPAS